MNVKCKAAQYFLFSSFKKIIFINRFNKLPNYVSLYFCNERSKYENENREVITSRDDRELNPQLCDLSEGDRESKTPFPRQDCVLQEGLFETWCGLNFHWNNVNIVEILCKTGTACDCHKFSFLNDIPPNTRCYEHCVFGEPWSASCDFYLHLIHIWPKDTHTHTHKPNLITPSIK